MKTKNYLIVGALLCGLSASAYAASRESLAIAGEFGTSKKTANNEIGDRFIAPDCIELLDVSLSQWEIFMGRGMLLSQDFRKEHFNPMTSPNEAAESFYRNIRLTPIKVFPEDIAAKAGLTTNGKPVSKSRLASEFQKLPSKQKHNLI